MQTTLEKATADQTAYRTMDLAIARSILVHDESRSDARVHHALRRLRSRTDVTPSERTRISQAIARAHSKAVC